MRRRLFVCLLVSGLLLWPSAARAISTSGAVRNVPYVIGFRPWNSMQQPYIGELTLNFNNGVISGRYTDTSIAPGSPFANRTNVPVSGGVTNGALTLIIGGITFRGSIRDDWMSGSATIRGRVYVFEAEQGRIGKPAQ